MSAKHPIIAITGSSGAGTTSVMRTFEHIFRRESVNAAIVEGDSFHRYDRAAMRERDGRGRARTASSHFSHFGPEANLFEELEQLFASYAESGTGKRRKYLHDAAEAAPYKQEPGTFTPGKTCRRTDLLFYEGLHGAVVHRERRRRAACRPADRRRAGHQPRMDPEAAPRQERRAATRPKP